MSAGTVDDLLRARRVVCFGSTGSGKTTLATALGERLGLPAVMLDDLCWDPGWVTVPADEQRRRVLPLLERDAWVFDALRSAIVDDAWPRIDAIVALDYERHVSLLRLVRRTWRRIRSREPVCNGNVETLRLAVARDSVVVWHFRSWRRKRRHMRRWHADAAAPPVLLLARPADARALLAQLRHPSGGAEKRLGNADEG